MSVTIKKGRALSTLSLTPLIDVVFLLLIFFLVATRFEQEERSLAVLLPDASEAMPLMVKPKQLIVNVDQRGRFFVSRRQVDDKELFELLKQSWANNPGRQSVIIRSDKRCPMEHVVVVMNLCNKANIRDYVVTAEADGA